MNKAIKVLLGQAINSQRYCGMTVKRCPNQIVGKIKITTSRNKCCVSWDEYIDTKGNLPVVGGKVCEREDIRDNLKVDNRSFIILVLESPHIDEFRDDGKPYGPAYGATGVYINKYFHKILEIALNNNVIPQSIVDGKYDIAIINAISFQCSIGVDTLLYRDAMFLLKWENDNNRKYFIKEIKSLTNYCDKYLVINCCTKGKHLDLLTNHKGGIDEKYLKEIGYDYSNNTVLSLKGFVSDEIHIANISQVYCTHPSSWRSKRNRKITNVL